MEQTLRLAHSGWSQEETELLLREIQAAADSGEPLRSVFEKTGEALGRKPNSVRNYYYMQLREQTIGQCRRAAPFETFSDTEIHDLLRYVLSAKGRGRSVRAAVQEMAGGDKTLTLRYQNKYRALLKKRPDLIGQICEELKAAGEPAPDMRVTIAPIVPASEEAPSALADDPDAQAILAALSSLLKRVSHQDSSAGDRLKVQRDLLMLQMEDLQSEVKSMVGVCKDFLGCPTEERSARLPDFCDAMASRIARLETVSG